MTQAQYKKWYYKNHRAYERISYGIVKKGLKDTLIKFQKSKPTADNYEKLLKQSVEKKDVSEMLYKLYLSVGLPHGNRIHKGIQDKTITIKSRWTTLFNERFAQAILDWLISAGGRNITTIRDTFIKDVLKFIGVRVTDGQSITKVTNEMIKDFGNKNGLYRYQIERIVRTETASAANFATFEAMDDEDLIIDKVWISSDDHRTRDGESKDEYDHIDMDGVIVPLNSYFHVENREGEVNSILYPVDMVHGVAGNIINCRCTIAPKPRRDKNGRLMRKRNVIKKN